MLRRPDPHDEFELVLGEAVTVMQLGNCDLVRLRGTSDGGVAAELCGWHSRAGTGTREAYGAERYNEARKAA